MPRPRRFPPPGRTPARAAALKTLLFTLADACGLLLYTSAHTAGAASAAAPTPQTGLVNVTASGVNSSQGFFAGTASVTPDGRYVVFASASPDLTPKVTPPGSQVYLRDLQAGTTKLVSANRIDGSAGNTSSGSDLGVSDDGRYVAFVSEAPDLVAGDNNGRGDGGNGVFVRGTVAGTTHLVSVNKGGTASGHGASGGLSMTPDGRFVVFMSAAFFLSIEFQETGYLAYKTYKAAYGNLVGRPVPIPLFWFIHDAQQIGRDVVVNQGTGAGSSNRTSADTSTASPATRASTSSTRPRARPRSSWARSTRTRAGC